MKRSALTVCVYFFSIFIIFVNAKKCHELNGLHEGDSCHQHWGKLKYRLHPTQLGIGKAWALKKYQTYMSNKEDAQNELDEKPVLW